MSSNGEAQSHSEKINKNKAIMINDKVTRVAPPKTIGDSGTPDQVKELPVFLNDTSKLQKQRVATYSQFSSQQNGLATKNGPQVFARNNLHLSKKICRRTNQSTNSGALSTKYGTENVNEKHLGSSQSIEILESVGQRPISGNLNAKNQNNQRRFSDNNQSKQNANYNTRNTDPMNKIFKAQTSSISPPNGTRFSNVMNGQAPQNLPIMKPPYSTDMTRKSAQGFNGLGSNNGSNKNSQKSIGFKQAPSGSLYSPVNFSSNNTDNQQQKLPGLMQRRVISTDREHQNFGGDPYN